MAAERARKARHFYNWRPPAGAPSVTSAIALVETTLLATRGRRLV
jgi:hypothetical protein